MKNYSREFINTSIDNSNNRIISLKSNRSQNRSLLISRKSHCDWCIIIFNPNEEILLNNTTSDKFSQLSSDHVS